jgi:hypothetical protein
VSLAVAVGLGEVVALATKPSIASRSLAVLGGVLALGLAPATFGGLGGAVRPSREPPSWARVASIIERCPGRTVALPWELYVDPGFTNGRGVRNPVPTWISRAALISRDPETPFIPDDSGAERRIGEAVLRAQQRVAEGHSSDFGARIRAHGVRWVVALRAKGAGANLLEQPDPDLEIVAELPSITLAWVKPVTGPQEPPAACR